MPKKKMKPIKGYAVVNKDFKFEPDWHNIWAVELFSRELQAEWRVKDMKSLKIIKVLITPL